MAVLADTNIISEFMRREPDPAVLRWAEQQSHFFVSVITAEELTFGLTRRRLPLKSQWLREFLECQCTVLPVTFGIAELAGTLRGGLAREGAVRHPADMLIAATARCHDLVLATRNVADFTGCGLSVINPFRLS